MSKLEQLLSSGVVAVVRKVDPEKVHMLVETLVNAGITGIEITLDSENAYETIEALSRKYTNSTAVIGAGTVLNKEEAVKAVQAGAEFVFSPILDKETVTYAKSQGKIVIPGVLTPSEMQQAYVWGADVVKVFPAHVLGAKYFKDLQGPLGHIAKMPTGGIDASNIGSYIQAGAVAGGAGGSLVNNQKIADSDWQSIHDEAITLIEEVRKARALLAAE